MKPLIVNQIYKEKIWGNNELLKLFNQKTEKEEIGECWNLALNDNDNSTFSNFNMNIKEILLNSDICKIIFGNKYVKLKKFPFLIKTLFVNGKISLQVHPNKKFREDDIEKNEVWYVLYADENAYANIGLKSKINKKVLREDTILDYLKQIKIKEGDIINIPAGTIHSVSGKAILYEVQQNCNITYRLYDWYERDLEIEKALKAINNKKVSVVNRKEGRLIKTKDFTIDRINISGKKEIRNRNTFRVITIISGTGTLLANENIELNKGMTILIPANIEKYIILGELSILVTY